MRTRIETWFRRFAIRGPETVSGHLLLAFLVPFGLLYGCIGMLRVALYRSGIFCSYQPPLPTVSVGNLALGGTGKTPVVDYLAKEARKRGSLPLIVSRGYGGRYSGCFKVVSDGEQIHCTSSECGDEPYLLALRNPGVPVIVARNRADGIKYGCARFNPDLIILDDGFQHLKVLRDENVLLLDGERPYGNGFPFPAGYLREFPFARHRATAVFQTSLLPGDRGEATLGFSLDDEGYTLKGERIRLADLAKSTVVAAAGIASPDRFFDALRKAGCFPVSVFSLPDHEEYHSGTVTELTKRMQKAEYLVVTEKDIVKIHATTFPITVVAIPLKVANSMELNAVILRASSVVR